MTQQVKLENGEIYEFPDDATTQEMNFALSHPNLNALANSSPVNFVLGAGDAVRNALGSTASLLPGVNISPVQSGEGTSYQAGNIAGNIGTFLGGGEALEGARALSEVIPFAGKAAQYLGENPILKRAIGSALGGGAVDQNDRIGGMEMGGALSPIFDLAPGILKNAASGISGISKKIFSSINPYEHAENTIHDVGQNAGLLSDEINGGQALTTNAKLLASNIENAYNKNKSNSEAEYGNIFNNPNLIHNKTVHQTVDYLGNPVSVEKTLYEQSSPGEKPYGSNTSLNNLHQQYIDNPTIQNAHKLQIELGNESAYLSKKYFMGTADNDERQLLGKMLGAREAAKNDIRSAINNNAPELGDAFDTATRNYDMNVVPYHSDINLKEIAQGKMRNPSVNTINSIFSNPESNINKIVSDLGDQGKNQILFNEIGKLNKSNLTPVKLINANEELDRKGLSSYRTPEFQANISHLPKKMAQSDIAERAGGAITGNLLGHAIGLPFLSEALSATGAFVGPSLFNNLPNIATKSAGINKSISNVIKKSYSPLNRAVLANMIQQNQ